MRRIHVSRLPAVGSPKHAKTTTTATHTHKKEASLTGQSWKPQKWGSRIRKASQVRLLLQSKADPINPCQDSPSGRGARYTKTTKQEQFYHTISAANCLQWTSKLYLKSATQLPDIIKEQPPTTAYFYVFLGRDENERRRPTFPRPV